MNFNVPVTSAFEIPVDDLLNLPEIHEVLSTERAVEGTNSSVLRRDGGWNAEDIRGPEASPERCSRGDEQCQKQEEKQKKYQSLAGTSQTSRSILDDSLADAATDEETKEETRSSSPPSSSKTLPTGQHVHILNDVEVSDLRQRLRARVASLSHDRREKEEILQKKKQIQKLQAELARLNDVEA
ncbi:hypothetical protein V7S43_017341 [Phytophthora oleae]|uniref:Uncharacterized protein n=1 Tax=Phytophthora oleae TaxID=2107226 RepID=A0ABD3EXS0_9STRA